MRLSYIPKNIREIAGKVPTAAHNVIGDVGRLGRAISSKFLTGISYGNGNTKKRLMDRAMGGYIRAFSKHPTAAFIGTAAMFGTGAMLSTMGTQMFKTVRFSPIAKPSSLKYGSGFISWGKTSGMPANNLSTDGLSLSLFNLRHSSML